MAGELVLPGGFDAEPGRKGRRELQLAAERALVGQAKIKYNERNRAFAAAEKVHNGYQIARLITHEATDLNREVEESTRGKPCLAAILSGVEVDTAFWARQVNGAYMTGR